MTGLETRSRRMRTVLWVLLVLVVAFYAFPFVYLLLTSFKTPSQVIAIPPSLLPADWTGQNYATALAKPNVVASFINSTITALITTAMSLVLAVPAAYGISRFKTRIGPVLLLAALVVRMVPPVAIGLPLTGTIRALGLSDTSFGLAIAHTIIGLPLSIVLMASFFEAVPGSLEEAARVDGCSRFGALWRVVLPVTAGGAAVTAIFAFLASWNEFLFALLTTSVRAQTTPIVIANFQTQFGLDWGPMTALATLYSIPVIVLTFLLQRHIVTGMTLGAVAD
ncbi:MAG TPA: carbohydrate ABC transporter permease [Actinomycetaceae bacterium]|nr:carbohydrate ABC transporter permease [Actinomycetaceae bacterium]